MVYIPKQNTFIVEIPKSGSRSLFYAANIANDHIENPAGGHRTISDMFSRVEFQPNPRVIAVVREPVDRLVSAINYLDRRHWSLDDKMDWVAKNAGCTTILFSQSHYLDRPDVPHQRYIYPLHRIDEVFRMIGQPPAKRNWNPHYSYSREQITSHRLFHQIMCNYKEDAHLWLCVN